MRSCIPCSLKSYWFTEFSSFSLGPEHFAPNIDSEVFLLLPRPSVYGILTYIWLKCVVNVGKYSIYTCSIWHGIGTTEKSWKYSMFEITNIWQTLQIRSLCQSMIGGYPVTSSALYWGSSTWIVWLFFFFRVVPWDENHHDQPPFGRTCFGSLFPSI